MAKGLSEEETGNETEGRELVKYVIVASEVPLYAGSIAALLTREAGVEVRTAPWRHGEELPGADVEDCDAVVVECGGMVDWNGLGALCRKAAPRPVIVLTRHAPLEMICQAREAGVRALVDLRADMAAMADALIRALEGEMVYPEPDEEAAQRSRPVRLTPREGQLVALLVQGMKNKEIAAQLELSEGTVKVYLSKLFQKVGAKDRFELALFGLRNLVNGEFGCLEPERKRKPARPAEARPRHGLRTLVVGAPGMAAKASALR